MLVHWCRKEKKMYVNIDTKIYVSYVLLYTYFFYFSYCTKCNGFYKVMLGMLCLWNCAHTIYMTCLTQPYACCPWFYVMRCKISVFLFCRKRLLCTQPQKPTVSLAGLTLMAILIHSLRLVCVHIHTCIYIYIYIYIWERERERIEILFLNNFHFFVLLGLAVGSLNCLVFLSAI